MDSKFYSIIFEGQIVPDRTTQEVKQNLAALLKVNLVQIERLFINSPIALRKNLTHSTALKYLKVLNQMGVICRLEGSEKADRPAQKLELAGSTSPSRDANTMICPNCAREQQRSEECIRCGTVIQKYLAKISHPSEDLSPLYSSPSQLKTGANSSNAFKFLSLAVIIFLLLILFNFWNDRPIHHGPGVVAPDKPIQTPILNADEFVYKDCRITPLAKFHIEARVLSEKRYYFDREAVLSPLDLALGWGPMSDDAVLEGITIRQSNRFYFWSAKRLPIPRKEIIENSANMHIIPADNLIEDRLKDIRKGNIVRIKGYLVRVKGDNGIWKSSLSRSDTGRGACELIWAIELDVMSTP